MPNSKRRKRLVASNKKQIERARRRIEAKTCGEADKENVTSDTAFLKESSSSCKTSSDSFEEEQHRRTDQQKERVSDVYESTTGWLGGLYSWCHSGLVQQMEVAKDIVFPSRVLKRQLEHAQHRLKEMEEQLETIRNKEQRERKRRKRERQSLLDMDSAETHHADSSSPPLPPPVAAAAPPPAPPPPPPPPPPPSLASGSQKPQQRRVMTRSRTAKLQKVGGKELPPISLDDIKSVKLKSIGDKRGIKRLRHSPRAAAGHSGGGGFVMTLADLKGVNLRRASIGSVSALATARRKPFHCAQAVDSTPEMFKVRSSLRRVNTQRHQSPARHQGEDERGGGRNCLDSGEGPTPMLARALRRKFQAACPLSPVGSLSPANNSSRGDSPISQSPPSPPPPSAQTVTTAPPSPPPNSTQTMTNASSPFSVLEIREV